MVSDIEYHILCTSHSIMSAIGKTFVYLGKESTNIYAFDNHNEFEGGPILTLVFDDLLSQICYCIMSLKTLIWSIKEGEKKQKVIQHLHGLDTKGGVLIRYYYVGVIWLPSLMRHMYLIGIQLGADQRTKHQRNTCVNTYWTTYSNYIKYSTLHREHNQEDLCIQY